MPYPQAIATGQVSVGTTATLIVPPRPDRKSVTIVLEGATPQQTFLGPAGVTSANGYPLPAVEGASVTIEGGAAVYGIVAATTQDVGYIEAFG